MGSFTSKYYLTYDDIDEINSKGGKLVVYKNKVYDISHITNHPAGYHLIEKNIGQDITQHMFFHSKNAKNKVKKHFIGYIKNLE